MYVGAQDAYVDLLPTRWLESIRSVNPFSTDQMVFLAEDRRTRQVIGFVGVGATPHLNGQNDSEVYALYVVPEPRSQNVALALLKAGLEWLQAKSFECPSVWVFDRPQSKNLLEGIGGELVEPVAEELPLGSRRAPKAHYTFDLKNWGRARELQRTRWKVALAAAPAGILAELFTKLMGIKAPIFGFRMDVMEVLATVPSILILPVAWMALTKRASPKSGLGLDSYTFWKQNGWLTVLLTYVSQVLIRTSGYAELSDSDILFFFYPAALIVLWIFLCLYSYLIRLLFRRGLYE